MTFLRLLALLALGIALAACSDGSDPAPAVAEPARPALKLNFSDAPIDLPNISARYAADVAYGEGERHRFDIYLPDCDSPTPLVVFIHGGGFTGGDKRSAHDNFSEDIRSFLQACVAYASINYSLLSVPDSDGEAAAAAEQGGVLTSMQDAARALQFMRYHYASLNLDVDNVAAYGVSAGAGTSLWLGARDDMADPDSADSILRESTRLKAAGALATQATYDILDWEAILLPFTEPLATVIGGTDIVTLVTVLDQVNYLLTFLAVPSIDALETPAATDYRAAVDMLEQLDAGDAPIYVENFATSTDDLVDLFLHHALHAIAVKARADEVGLESIGYSRDPAWPLQEPSDEGRVSFLLRHIQ